ncbi:hypothetical protein EDD29_5356 [Actinocorallia herbida]|uniref:Uncharacterized protein n=1 Tax=Actinocorallia herbida TaxID=58109 RepID=A0A3N1D2G1_9ACTN|nr:hypothetical protein EDD29_5356 [Actinocorallia herbida]
MERLTILAGTALALALVSGCGADDTGKAAEAPMGAA